jgi:PAS domain S-box-containing protein
MSDLVLRPQELGIGRLFDSVRDAVIVATAETGRIVLWNPAASEVFGYSLPEALDMNVEALVPEPLRSQHRAGLSRYRDTGHGPYVDSAEVLELPAVCKGGEEIYIELTLSPLEPVHDSKAEGRFVLAIIRDVTERKRAEEALRASESELRTLFAAMTDVICVLDNEGRYLDIAPTNPSLLYRPPAELMGRKLHEVFPKEKADTFLVSIRRALETHQAAEFEYTLEIGGREIWFAATVSPMVEDRVLWVARDITKRKEAEEALRQSEERYRLVAKATNEAIWDSDVLADRQKWDGALEAMFGYPAGLETNTAWWEDHVHPQDRERVLAGINTVLHSGGEMWSEEYRFRRADGEYSSVVDRAYVVRNAEGEAVRVIGSMMDVTERKEAEEEIRRLNQSLERRVEERTAELEAAVAELRENERRLRESEERYRLVVEASNDGIFDWDLRTNELFWNDRLFEIMGLSGEEVSPTFGLFVELLHPDDKQRTLDAVTAHLEHGSEYDVECRLHRSDGSYRFCHVRGEAQRGENGVPTRMTGVVEDVTERKRAEEALRTSETRFRALVEQIPAITYIEAVDNEEPTTEFLYVSPQIETMFGYSPEEWVADPGLFPKHLHPEDRERVLAEDARTEATGEPFRTEYRQYTRDGRLVWVRDEAVLVHDEAGEPLYWLGIQMDITERKLAEERQAELVEELRRSNAELEQFAYVASHDLQEPLRMVASYTQLLGRRYKGRLDDDADEFIDYAVDGANRMQTLINDLLTYSRVGTRGRELVPTDTHAAFEAACANLRTAIEESGATVTSEELPVVMGDHTQLVQLFQNLLANAIKFRSEEPVEVHVGAERREGEWLLWVADNGIGIDEHYAERIFRIFQRLHGKGEYSGTGIGLAVCKKIVERHGGRIWVESSPGRGATFYFTLRPLENGA